MQKILTLSLFVASAASALAGAGPSSGYALFVAETTAGSLGGNTAAYGGVQRYNFTLSGGAATTGTGIPADQLSDPAGLFYANSKLFVSNRHGNTLGQGSVKAFDWDGSALSAVGTTVATSTSASYAGFCGAMIASDGKLYVATVNGGSRQYTPSGPTFTDTGGTTQQPQRDIWISPNGLVSIETGITGNLRVSDLTGSTFSNYQSFSVSGANTMHQLAYRGGALYCASFLTGTVHRIDLGPNFKPVSSTLLFSLPSGLGIAFSPDGYEMYVSGHTSNRISRFVEAGDGTWIANGFIATGVNMGYLAVIPGPVDAVCGRINLSGLAGTIHNTPLTVEVWNGPTLVETINTTLGAGSTFEFEPSESSGNRTLIFQTRAGLRKAVNVTLQPTPVTGVIVNMANGDVDLSGEVDAADIDLVIAAFGGSSPMPDVDGTGEVDAADIDVVIANFGAVGD
ncbi:MAG: hypothetical protein IT205_02280 [Fimbriimonadaceae bacterium]|nr:hypothetical protein [Fimbriimonadaceae bacterium]